MSLKCFEVVAGRIYHDDGKMYKVGDVVTDSRDLLKAFPNKLKIVTSPVSAVGVSSVVIASPSGEVGVKPATSPEGEKLERPTPPENKPPEKRPEVAVHPKFGCDVTTKFEPLASEAEVMVYKKGKKYFVCDREDNVWLNKKKEIVSEEAVNTFLNGFAKE